ncbi:MAG: roadblock/LC7 domain-containing protein [Micrococcales bacterium]|nr:roadblock/LC7 domain-containing protein [Micrococcales bacterium]
MSIPAHLDPQVKEHAARVLAGMREFAASMIYAAVLTDDGFEVADYSDGRTDASRMASMSSSVQALSDAVARELRIGTAEYVIIASDQGHVLQRRVPGQPLVLAALFDTYETLGKAIAVSKMGAQRMAHSPASEPGPAPAPTAVPEPAPADPAPIVAAVPPRDETTPRSIYAPPVSASGW